MSDSDCTALYSQQQASVTTCVEAKRRRQTTCTAAHFCFGTTNLPEMDVLVWFVACACQRNECIVKFQTVCMPPQAVEEIELTSTRLRPVFVGDSSFLFVHRTANLLNLSSEAERSLHPILGDSVSSRYSLFDSMSYEQMPALCVACLWDITTSAERYRFLSFRSFTSMPHTLACRLQTQLHVRYVSSC